MAFTDWHEEPQPHGAQRQGQASWRCTGCGDESGVGWGWGGVTRANGGTSTVASRSPAFIADARPGETSISPTLPPAARPPTLPSEVLEHEQLWEDALRNVEERGFAAMLDYVSFPVFALRSASADGRRLRPCSRSCANYGWTRGEPARAGVSNVSLAYVGSDYDEAQESVLVQSTDVATEPVHSLPERHRLHRKAVLLESFVSFTPAPLRQLSAGATYRQFINVDALSRAAVLRMTHTLSSGESASWDVRHLPAPVPLAFAETQVAGASLSIALAGAAAGRLDDILGSLTRLERGTDELTVLEAGLREAREHLQTAPGSRPSDPPPDSGDARRKHAAADQSSAHRPSSIGHLSTGPGSGKA